MPVKSGWLQAIAGLELLVVESLTTHGFQFLLTGRFNQDALEVISLFRIVTSNLV